MLLGNITRIAQNPIAHSAYNGANERSQWGLNTSTRLLKFSALNQNNGIPSGYTPHYSWSPSIKGNGIATLIKSNGSINRAELANAINLLNTASPAEGIGDVNTAILQMITSLQATVTGEGTVNTAQLAGISSLVALVTASGGVNTAIMGAIANMSATVSGVGSVIAELYGLLHLSGHIYVNEGAQTAEQLAAAVWAAPVTGNHEVDTMGELLYGAGGGSSPSAIADAVWDELLNGHVVAGSAGETLAAAGVGGVDYDAIADAVWDADKTEHTATDSMGKEVQDTKRDVGDAQALILSI